MIRLPACERLAEPRRAHRLLAARGPRAEPRRAVEAVVVAQPGAAEAGPALARRGVVHRLGLRDLFGRRGEQDDVVDDVGVARLDERAGQEDVLGQVRVEQEAAVVVGAGAGGGRGRVRRGHLAASSASRPGAAAGAWSCRPHGCGRRSTAGPWPCRWCRRFAAGVGSLVIVVMVPTGTRSASSVASEAPQPASAAARTTAAVIAVSRVAMSSPFRRARAGGCGTQSDPHPRRC